MKLLRPRYSLRALLLLVLVSCAALGYLVHKAHENDRLIARAGRQFAVVEFNEWGPAWLRNWVGAWYFREPVALYVPRDFAENCLPLLEEYPSIKMYFVLDTAKSGAGDIAKQVDRVRPDALTIGLDHRYNWNSTTRFGLFDESAAECRQLAAILSQRSLKLPMRREAINFQAFTFLADGEELQLFLLHGDLNVVLLARETRLIDHVAITGRDTVVLGKQLAIARFEGAVPVVVDADADGRPDIGFFRFAYPPFFPRRIC